MPLGLYFDGMSRLDEFVKFAGGAERLGVDSIWVAEHFCFRDAFACASALLASTDRLTVVPGPISPYSRHPMTIAMAAATLSELGPERVALNLGTGNLAAQQEFGVEVTRPVETMTEAIDGIQRLIRGENVRFEGQCFSFKGSKMGFGCASIPIYMSAVGPRMIAAAGRRADGLVLSAGVSPAFAKLSLERAHAARTEAGRAINGFKRTCAIIASTAPDRREAYATTKALLSYLFRVPVLAEDWALNGTRIDHHAILEAITRQDRVAAMTYISDEAVEVHTASGSPSEFKDRLQNYLDAGIDLPILILQGSVERRMLALQMALEVCGPRLPL